METPDQGDLVEAYRYCDRIARQRARNFYPAFRFLPRQRRLALSAFYVFCSFSDDIVDDSSGLSPAERREKLNAWRNSLKHCFDGETDSPLFFALNDSIHRFELPKEPFFDLLRGVEMDLLPRRFPAFSDLETYCRLVASSVGLVSVRIFGCTESGADQYANALGIALQLTNILRDMIEDIERGRIYIPTEDLERFSYNEKDLQNRVYDHRFMELMRFQYDRAQQFFDDADPGLAGVHSRKLLPAEIMKSVYQRILEEIRRRNFNVFAGRVAIPKWRVISGISQILIRRLLS